MLAAAIEKEGYGAESEDGYTKRDTDANANFGCVLAVILGI
jgi:hypothetical protein